MHQKPGFILITTTLILLAVSVTLVAATFSFSLGSTGRSLALERGEQALAMTEGCMEEALFRIRGNADAGDETIELDGVACDIEVERAGDDYTVVVEVESSGHTRRVTAEANRGANQMTLSSWIVE
ncbi:MAG: hypothetical protein IPJ68_06065 [Candidatus Moraniibacteriota bacterium]|nr:MAG: hypothetical protein IPJ68_06065 [Candidatus Moranbacteria bacterium]